MSFTRRTYLAYVAAIATLPFCGGCTSTQAHMKPSDSEEKMRAWLAQRGLSPSTSGVPQLSDAVLSFYESVRASGVVKNGDGDMLLFQWGVFDWGMGENFEFDLTRQFISSGFLGDEAFSQLRCTGYFAPTAELRAIPKANRWCRSTDELESFSKFIRSSPAYQATAASQPLRVSIEWRKL
jgi:hypothetical protein